ncbi:MAG: hypothetical protein OdinLCB4_006960 [Candidatus Odinarchaeum yellowstonii]|uniref:Uncharacterized protein n=1 Tax=Odinarchaeota yellowstonii (strain LCB_4) TaxID=1841599 RepID=A0AAF0D208_ODILC|nr:MAG: hypothetical protein OdinLCB4_006960 [Candidatus Odinarchaeum yellowstonii]
MSKTLTLSLLIAAFLIIPLIFLPVETISQPVEGSPFEVKPVGIVFSNLSLNWKQATYNNSNISVPVIMPFYLVESHIYMAGLRFEVLPEENITGSEVLEKYSCIILPENTHISNTSRLTLLNYYKEYLHNGGGLIAFGYIGVKNEYNASYSNSDIFWRELFNIKTNGFLYVNYSITTLEHPITKDYVENTTLYNKGLGLDNVTVNSTSINTQPFLKAINNQTKEFITYCGFASQIGNGRSVFINVYDLGVNPWFDQTTLLLKALQWCIFRDYPATALQPTPGRLTWIFTVDQDWCFATVNTTNALRRLLNLADTYYFTFGWAIISEGPVKQSGEYYGYINWSACKPLFIEAYRKGHDLASHSVTHVYWDLTPVNETRVLKELNLSKIQIEGNLSIPVTGLQVWGQGIWFSRYNASIYLPKVGYQYITELSVEGFPYLMGWEFYYTGGGNIDFNNTVFVLFRQSYSDHNYFSPTQMNLNWSKAWEIEKKNFDNAYRIGNGMPYTLLWHDYSIDNVSRLPLLYKILDYELWQRKDVYTCTPYEYYHRIQAHDAIKYNVTYYSNNTIKITLDTRSVGDEYLDYITGQTIRFDNLSLYVKNVKINSQDYRFFSNSTVILPKLNRGVHTITVSFDSQPSNQPRVVGCTFGGPVTASYASETFTFNFTSPKQRDGRVIVELNNTPVTIFVNRTLTDKWYYNGKTLILALNATGNTLIEVYYSLRFTASILKVDKRIYFPSDPITVNYTLTNNYPFPLNLRIKAIISASNISLGEAERVLTIGVGETYNGWLTIQPYSTWPSDILNAELKVISGYALLYSTSSTGSVYVYWFNGELLIASLSFIAVFTLIIAFTNRFIGSKKIRKIGGFITSGLFTATPIIFNLGFILLLGYHYSQILTPVETNLLALVYSIMLPVAFTFYGLDHLTRKYTLEAALSEDPSLTKKYVKQGLLTSFYFTITVTCGLILFSAVTGLISLDIILAALICIIPNIFLLSFIGAYKALNRTYIVSVAYLAAMAFTTVISLYTSYYIGLLGVILPYSASLIAACFFLAVYLFNRFLKKGRLPLVESEYYTKIFKESRFDLKTIILGGLIINLFMLTSYLTWFIYGWTTTGFSVLLNSPLQTPIAILQLTVYPAMGVAGVLITGLRESLNEFSRLKAARKRDIVDSYDNVLKEYRKLIIGVAVAAAIITAPITYFLNNILSFFNLTLNITILEVALLAVGWVLYSILLAQILFHAMINVKSSCVSLMIAFAITIIVSLMLPLTGVLNAYTSVLIGFASGLAAALFYSARTVLKKLKHASRF